MAFDLSYAVRRVRLYAGDAVVLLCDSSSLLSYFSYNVSLRGYAAFSKRVTHYDTFSGAAKMSFPWALRGGIPLRKISARWAHIFSCGQGSALDDCGRLPGRAGF